MVAEERRKDHMRAAEEHGRQRHLRGTGGRRSKATAWTAARLGALLIALGTRLQGYSANVSAGIRAAGASAGNAEIACADPNC